METEGNKEELSPKKKAEILEYIKRHQDEGWPSIAHRFGVRAKQVSDIWFDHLTGF